MPKYIYKYRSLNNPRHVQELIDSQISFARSETFNDPFDGTPPVSFVSYSAMQYVVEQNPLHTMLKGDAKHQIILDSVRRAQQMMAEGRISEHEAWPYFELIIREIIPKFICSASLKNRNLLMWSHYADHHRGICLRFNLDTLKNSQDLDSDGPVKYDDNVPDLLMGMFNQEEINFAETILYQKAKDWGYEEEYRLILKEKAQSKDDLYRTVAYPNDALDRVYFGFSATPESIEEIRTRLDDRNIRYYKMKAANLSLEVFAEEI